MTIKRYNQAFHEMAGGFMQDHPEGEYVKWEDVEKLAVELCAVEQIHSEAVFVTDEDYEQCPSNVQNIIRHLAVMKMPTYEALANQLRAEGVEMFAAWASQQEQFARESRDAGSALINRNCEARAKSFAAALRAGKDGE